MTNKISYAITRRPPNSMAKGITTQNAIVDLMLAREQHKMYVAALQSVGVDVTVLDPEEDFPDSHFVEDTAIIHKNVAILTRPGAEQRRGEIDKMRAALTGVLTVRDFGGDENTLLDGGDVLITGNNVLIGLSYRTNQAGAKRLGSLLTEIDPNLEIYFVSFDGVLHLKSGLSALNTEQFLASPTMKINSKLPGEITWLPDDEAHSANTLTVNGAILHSPNCNEVSANAKRAGLKPIAVDISEFNKMDGGFTCLSLLW